MEAIKLPMKRGRMEDIGDEEVYFSVHIDIIMINYDVVQGNSMATQSEETGSTAMMDIDSMNSQVQIEDMKTFTISDVWMLWDTANLFT